MVEHPSWVTSDPVTELGGLVVNVTPAFAPKYQLLPGLNCWAKTAGEWQKNNHPKKTFKLIFDSIAPWCL
jgi:hypothetical protein